jgi:diketogulonate reductase-like aldo/keto reductase
MNIFFGTYKLLDETILYQTLTYAYETGYRFFDCAELYKNQHMIGDFFKKNNIPRESYWLTSKLSFRTIPKGELAIRTALDKTLADLNTSYLDLMLIHAPIKNDIMAWKILTEYKEKGFFKNIGISNYNTEKLVEFINSIENPQDIYCNQIEFNPFLNRSELIQLCSSYNIKIISYGSLYKSNELIERIADRLNRTKEQILLKYALQTNFSTIITATNKDYIESDYKLDFTIDQEDMTLLNLLNENFSMYKRFL